MKNVITVPGMSLPVETHEFETAIHEAAHAVLAHRFNSQIRSVTIEPCGSNDGSASTDPDPDVDADSVDAYFAVQKEVIALLAGAEAVRQFREQYCPVRMNEPYGDESDKATARNLLVHSAILFAEEPVEVGMQRLQEVTAVAAGGVFAQIHILARHLLDRRALSGEQVVAILDDITREDAVQLEATATVSAVSQNRPGRVE